MMKTIACVMLGAVLACGNNQAQPEPASPAASAPAASSAVPLVASAAPSASASTTSAPVASGSAAPAAPDPGVVIQLKGNLIMVDGTVAGALGDLKLDDLSTKLKSTRDLWIKVHTGQAFPGRATIKAEKTTPPAAITHILDVAKNAGYPNAALAAP